MLQGSPQVAEAIRKASRVVFSTIVVGELLLGFRNGSRYRQYLDRLRSFLERPVVEVLPVSLVTAERFVIVTTALKKKGRSLPTSDVWIAAHAFESGAELLSFDLHFAHIDGLAWRYLGG
jgi:tRNA(fMet)-specific endonuclease VapC